MRKLYYPIVLLMVLLLVGCSRYPNLVHSPDDVEGKLIGGLEGTPSLRLAGEWGTARAFYSEEDMMNELRSGLIDCVIMERTTAQDLVSSTSGVRILPDPLVEYELSFAIPMENAALLKAIDEALEELGRNNTLRGLSNKYFSRGDFSYVTPDDTIARHGELTIALPPDSPPFSFRNDEGNFVGMDVEIAIIVSDFIGVELSVVPTDAWELVTAVYHGRADMALGWHPGEGEGIVSVSIPYARAVHVIIVRR